MATNYHIITIIINIKVEDVGTGGAYYEPGYNNNNNRINK